MADHDTAFTPASTPASADTSTPQLRVESLLVAAARPAPEENAPVNDPVHFTSTFHGTATDAVPGQRVYARMSNPTFDGPERLLAELEQVRDAEATPALFFGSGMAAITAVLHLVPVGGHVVVPRHAYQGLGSLLDQLAEAGQLSVTRVDLRDLDEVREVLDQRRNAGGTVDLLWLESPTNPMLEVADLPALVALAHEYGALCAVDNTFATPLLQQPLRLGADVVVHSVTKYLAGHSDLIMGAVVVDDVELRARLAGHRTLFGAIPSAMDVYLALRGMRTLALRLERAMDSAAELARRLEARGSDPVRYPGLASHEGHALAAATLQGGFGAVLTVDLGSAARADAVVHGLRLWTPATSLGGVESLVERRRRFSSEPSTVPEGMLRLSVGIEHAEDLWADLDQALRAADAQSGAGR
ncbi:trans-sulfuration enzyme family protein [Citricoccus muralis]|uniref:PLP-dependent transferase n=1 Tax=Citricoccus muralis TaxID=169134 RepID=A0ABY8H968_9MICC|nr:PLP-dependent transferase [Citricoccus muralis]WFP17203.1 PLP-dependent transferase [Citricoccus muralis]